MYFMFDVTNLIEQMLKYSNIFKFKNKLKNA